MRPALARRLERALWLQRLRTLGPTVLFLIVCVVLGGYVFSQRLDRTDPTVSLTQISGTITEAHRVAGRAAVFVAHVRLDDGREVDADSVLATVLVPNERVSVSIARHASGKLSFHVVQIVN